MRGRIIKGIGGFYYIDLEGKDEILECKARGRFRNNSLKPVVGDMVEVDEEKSYITEIYDRRNFLVRPPVSNIDRNVLVFSSKNPDLNFLMLDKFLLMSENKNLNVAICITKIDLDEAKVYKKVKDIYEKIGYTVFGFSKITGKGMDDIKNYVSSEGTTIFSGLSGVGKSTIINALNPNLNVQTGEVSKKLSRGKHTTRHVEFFKVERGYIADTPGFSSFELDINYGNLENLYPEFKEYLSECYFTKCSHIVEPKCSVKDALEKGLIDSGRYERYCMIYKEIKENFKR